MVPDPGVRIDRFSNGSEYPEAFARMSLNRLGTVSGKSTDSRWGRIEDGNAMSLDHVPITPRIRVQWSRFEHECRRSIGQRAIDDIAVPSDPPHISDAGVDVIFTQVKHGAMGVGCIGQVSPDV